ncbi:carbohydrate esterase family 10 protein [Ceratobasidium sp. AG-Ba]|nr:carbohydrate esterase family 10 protein [Ceratobasidium sp. AG-Ba]
MSTSEPSYPIPRSILDRLDPEYRDFTLAFPPPFLRPENPVLSPNFREAGKDSPPVELGEATGVPVRATQTIEFDGFSAKVLIPFGDKPEGGWPVFIWIHGGAWIFGHADSGLSTYSRACVEARCIVMSIEYRMAPEHPFPAAADDLWTTLTWVREEGNRTLGIDPNRIAVGGASAGGNLAAVLAQRAAAASPPIPILLQVLMVPITDCTYTEDPSTWSASMVEYANLFALRAEDMIWARNIYLPNPAHRQIPDASPLLQDNELVYKNLAPAWVGVVELDVLRSEGETYAEKMKRFGVPVQLTIYKGATHLTPAADRVCALSRKMRSDQVAAIKSAFAREN